MKAVKIREINSYLMCPLCSGYLIDAATITECLHTFCRSCIVRHFQKSKVCPICWLKTHETQPLFNLRPDRAMQDIVYKLVPNLKKKEASEKKAFYESQGLPIPDYELESSNCHSASGTVTERHFNRDEEQVTLQVEQHNSSLKCSYVKPLDRRYLRCSAQTTIAHLRQLVTKKLQLPPLYDLEVLCNDEVMHHDQMLGSVWLTHWKQVSPMPIYYRIKKQCLYS
ncbi:polycomb group RING finger protein 1-like [Corticium candelabrum]|uniref:polycomb group RING finger protein 1-like n=1 Tax=Corticium candelabrum TaxID=121492 RepID=UPI002E2732D5|nr:polycomb group RING finger protein 1-like [Corticium candelabrum]